MDQDIERVLFSHETLQARIKELADEIAKDYHDKNPIVVCVLRGAVQFYVDLTRKMDILMEMDFMSVSSYGDEFSSSGEITIKKDLESDIKGRHVLIVEDIIDTGLTLQELLKVLRAREPASLKVCALLDKSECRKHEVPIDYRGFQVENVFILGYGLDFRGQYRNLPYIGVMKPSKI